MCFSSFTEQYVYSYICIFLKYSTFSVISLMILPYLRLCLWYRKSLYAIHCLSKFDCVLLPFQRVKEKMKKRETHRNASQVPVSTWKVWLKSFRDYSLEISLTVKTFKNSISSWCNNSQILAVQYTIYNIFHIYFRLKWLMWI